MERIDCGWKEGEMGGDRRQRDAGTGSERKRDGLSDKAKKALDEREDE